MSMLPPNRNPAFEAVIRRLLANRSRPPKVAGKSNAKPPQVRKNNVEAHATPQGRR
jgi:hypothetical protein